MKTVKFLMIAIIAFTTVFTSKADDDKPITVDQLPTAAQEFIKTYFTDVQVSYATVDEGYFGKSYDVNFMGGAEVEFDENGAWKEIDCRYNALPANIVPEQIVNYVTQNHAGQIITMIDKGRRDYEIELGNGLEIKFDLNFKMIGYDH